MISSSNNRVYYNLRYVVNPNPNYERQKWDCLNEDIFSSKSSFVNLKQLNLKKNLYEIIPYLSETEKNLVIIGNGFDRAHGLYTSYTDFKSNFIDKEILNGNKEVKLFKDYYEQEFVSRGYLWSDIENSLSKLSLVFSIHNKCKSIQALQKHIEHIKYVYNKFPSYLGQWICDIDANLNNLKIIKKESIENLLSTNCSVINFNYTSTLMYLYSFPSSRVCFIHGQANKRTVQGELLYEPSVNNTIKQYISPNLANEYLVCGTCIGKSSLKLLKNNLKKKMRYLNGCQENEANKLIDKFISQYDNFKIENKNYIIPSQNLETVLSSTYDNVIILGHALGACDYGRFDYFKNLLKHSKWYIGIYDDIYSRRKFLNNSKNCTADNLKKFIKFMKISPQKITLFSTLKL